MSLVKATLESKLRRLMVDEPSDICDYLEQVDEADVPELMMGLFGDTKEIRSLIKEYLEARKTGVWEDSDGDIGEKLPQAQADKEVAKAETEAQEPVTQTKTKHDRKQQQLAQSRRMRGGNMKITKVKGKAKTTKQEPESESSKGDDKIPAKPPAPVLASEPPKEVKPSIAPLQKGTAKYVCGCFGYVHKPIANCLVCGRIACEQEGLDFCPHCGYKIEAGSSSKGGNAAERHKERLLRFDKENAARTAVFDDQADYFSSSNDTWLTDKEREGAKEKDEEKRKKMHERQTASTLDLNQILK